LGHASVSRKKIRPRIGVTTTDRFVRKAETVGVVPTSPVACRMNAP
jgi:hypothetical protein